jgi:AAA ATPase domain
MRFPMIDREEAVARFYQLLDQAEPLRVMRLLGEAKMGKTHLLTKVFPRLAERVARCAVLDLRNTQQTIIIHLHNACGQLGRSDFPTFDGAYTDWINQPQIQVRGLSALFSIISARSRSEEDVVTRVIPHLTRCFVDDLRRLDDRLLVLIFDQVDDAASETQTWLMDTLLGQIQGLAHVRVVVGGRIIPEALGSYARLCWSYELPPVREESAYIAYCKEIGANLGEQSIRDFARAFHYAPGAFAEIVHTFVSKGLSHG